MQELAVFDRCLVRRSRSSASHHLSNGIPRPQAAGRAPAVPASLARAAEHLISPWGEVIAAMPRRASAASIVRAAHGVKRTDWLAVLADDSLSRGTQTAWRLALWRAHGAEGSRSVAANGPGPQWLSSVVWARPGQSPADLHQRVLAKALAALWQEGWRLHEAFSADLH
ncbi:hypothetical protein [Roseateles sp.]|uniref:hypothetical protein n=1 Tax=Roseateles sp. TaxID=1971397 RepID=UPI003BAC6B53